MTAEKSPLSNQGETSREAVTDRLARLDDYGKLELFSTCHNCAKWQEVLFADNAHCIKPKVAKALLPGTLFVLAAGVYNFVILIGAMF